MSKLRIEPIKPDIGARAYVDKAHLGEPEVAEAIRAQLETQGVVVFPEIFASDEEQLAFTDALGSRVNYNGQVAGSNATMQDVYKVTLDKEFNPEPDYVLGTFFWHIDGMTIDMAIPKATVLSARGLSAEGGATEFANLYAAYDALSDAEKREIDGLRVIHTVEASVRPVYGTPPRERIERWRGMANPMEHPLVWTHDDGRKSLLVGSHGEAIVGQPGAHGRALLQRLQQWAAQPAFTYRHDWKLGDMVVWNNQGMMHRVVPYTDSSRVMHRTSVSGIEKPGHLASNEDVERFREVA